MSVDLPEPDGPMTAANCPRGKLTSTPRSASTAASPVPNVRFRPTALTAAPVPLAASAVSIVAVSVTAASSLAPRRHPRRTPIAAGLAGARH